MPRARPALLLLVLAGLAAAPPARAHFNLVKPASWANQDSDGDPQKSPPCGNEFAVETGIVNEYKVGDTIDITIRETIPHPGHYRVSLARDQASLPDDPDSEVVPGPTDCGSLAIKTNPTLPLLADGLLVHTRAFSGPQTMKVTLPAGMLCDHCVLQIVEFMSDHGAPCFYHHCANIKITATGPDAGVPGDDGGTDAGDPMAGCCSAQGNSSSAVLALLVGALVLRRRARRGGVVRGE
jgi:uncharacterized protein (TIGR03382 family)